MKKQFKAIVTGHSKGLGEAVARSLLTRQIPVLGLARHTSAALSEEFPSLCVQTMIDLANPQGLAEWLRSGLLDTYVSHCDTILLVNNAGTVQPVGAPGQQDPDQVAAAVSLNVTAPLMLSAAVARAAGARQRRIVHISSGAARNAYPGWSIYCATKAALDHHARAVALDGHAGVQICSLAPGIIDTAMQAEIRATPEQRFPLRARFVDLKQTGQLTAPADCARQLVDYLLSPAFGTQPVDDLRD